MAMNRENGYAPTWGLPLMMMMMNFPLFNSRKSDNHYNYDNNNNSGQR